MSVQIARDGNGSLLVAYLGEPNEKTAAAIRAVLERTRGCPDCSPQDFCSAHRVEIEALGQTAEARVVAAARAYVEALGAEAAAYGHWSNVRFTREGQQASEECGAAKERLECAIDALRAAVAALEGEQ